MSSKTFQRGLFEQLEARILLAGDGLAPGRIKAARPVDATLEPAALVELPTLDAPAAGWIGAATDSILVLPDKARSPISAKSNVEPVDSVPAVDRNVSVVRVDPQPTEIVTPTPDAPSALTGTAPVINRVAMQPIDQGPASEPIAQPTEIVTPTPDAPSALTETAPIINRVAVSRVDQAAASSRPTITVPDEKRESIVAVTRADSVGPSATEERDTPTVRAELQTREIAPEPAVTISGWAEAEAALQAKSSTVGEPVNRHVIMPVTGRTKKAAVSAADESLAFTRARANKLSEIATLRDRAADERIDKVSTDDPLAERDRTSEVGIDGKEPEPTSPQGAEVGLIDDLGGLEGPACETDSDRPAPDAGIQIVPPPSDSGAQARAEDPAPATQDSLPPSGRSFLDRAKASAGGRRSTSGWQSRSGAVVRRTAGPTEDAMLLVAMDDLPTPDQASSANAEDASDKSGGSMSGAVLTVAMGHPLTRLVVTADGTDAGGSAVGLALARAPAGQGRRRRRKSSSGQAAGDRDADFDETTDVASDGLPPNGFASGLADLALLAYLDGKASTGNAEAGDAKASSAGAGWYQASLGVGASSLAGSAALLALGRRRTASQARRRTLLCPPSYTGPTLARLRTED